MDRTPITAPARSHILPVIGSLIVTGWRVLQAPAQGRLARNGQLLTLQSGTEERRIRLFVYKVTGSGRNRPDERRIEITSTYDKGLRRLRDYRDIVMGHEVERNLFVGVDPRRIKHGGPTGNASSFFDIAGLAWERDDEILISPRATRLLPGGLENHAFLHPSRLAEYFFNFQTIHAGTYAGAGHFSGSPPDTEYATDVAADATGGDVIVLHGPRSAQAQRRRLGRRLIEAFEVGDTSVLSRRKVSPQEFLEIRQRMDENGRLGEEHVLHHERRALRRAGRPDLADRVHWVSQDSVGEGFDILSFEATGAPKMIEVKATAGNTRTFPMSDHEWRTCCEAKESYYIYRVSYVRTAPRIEQIRDPQLLEAQGLIRKVAAGWWVILP